MKILLFFFVTIWVTFATTMSTAAPQSKQDRRQSWFTWSVDWMKSISEASEHISEATQEMMMTSPSGKTNFVTDPVRNLAAAMTDLVGGTHSVAQVQTSMPNDEKKRHLKYHQDRNRKNSADRSKNEVDMLLEKEEHEDDGQQRDDAAASPQKAMIGNARNRFSDAATVTKDKKFSFSAHVVAQQQLLHERLHARGRNIVDGSSKHHHQHQQQQHHHHREEQQQGHEVQFEQGIVSGKQLNKNQGSRMQQELKSRHSDASLRQEATDRRNALVLDERHGDLLSNRDAEVLATSVTKSPDLLAAHNLFAFFCWSGVVAVPYTPSMKFTCFDPESLDANSNYTVSGANYSSPDFPYRNRTACYPQEAYLPKYCVCSLDRNLIRFDSEGSFMCQSSTYDCNLTVTEPSTYMSGRDEALRRTLLQGVPMRLPYVGTIDRLESATPVRVSSTLNCLPKPYVDSDSADGITYVAPSQASPFGSRLVVAYFGSNPSSIDVNTTSTGVDVEGTYSQLQSSMFQYLSNLTSSSSSTSSFFVTPSNYLVVQSLFFLRPHSFLDFSDVTGASVIRLKDLMVTPAGVGVLVGAQNISLTFVPSQLGDGFFVGAQLSVEFGLMLPPVSPAAPLQRNVSYLSANFYGKFTPLAHLITFDVVNAPPPLPLAPTLPLETTTIVLIALASVAAAAGIVGIVVGIFRYRAAKERKMKRRQERRLMRAELKRKKEEGETDEAELVSD